jgi:hypothetical protein
MFHSLLALLLGVILSLGLGSGMAEAMGQPALASAPGSALMAAAPVPAGDIKTFAKAYQAIQTIRDEAEADMAAAVAAEGFTVEEFNALADQALADNQPPSSAAFQRFSPWRVASAASARADAQGLDEPDMGPLGLSAADYAPPTGPPHLPMSSL